MGKITSIELIGLTVSYNYSDTRTSFLLLVNKQTYFLHLILLCSMLHFTLRDIVSPHGLFSGCVLP